MQTSNSEKSWLDRPFASFLPGLNKETVLILLILTLAIFSRFYEVGDRVMSFDEINHVVPGYDFSQGRGYSYNPMTHGPLQFHMIALSFFILGDNDTSARLPAVLFGIGTILFVLLAYRRFLGRMGALAAGFFLLISPYMLFYSRYIRNEIYIAFWAAALLYAVLAYLESGRARYLFLFTLINALHFVDKATAYIFAGEIAVFLVMYFILSMLLQTWATPGLKRNFIYTLLVLVFLAAVTLGIFVTGKPPVAMGENATAATMRSSLLSGLTPITRIILLISLGGILLSIAAAGYFLVKGIGVKRIRSERSFDLILLEVTLVLPLSAALFIQSAGFDPLNTSQSGLLTSSLFILPLASAAIFIGFWWRRDIWLRCMAIFWTIFGLFYSTFLTNGLGVPMGLVGSLGYWMAQQEVQRGSQPLYYYFLVQLPMYEFLPMLGTLAALVVGFRHKLWSAMPGFPFLRAEEGNGGIAEVQELDAYPLEACGISAEPPVVGEVPQKPIPAEPVDSKTTHATLSDHEVNPQLPVPTLALLAFWSISSLVIFSLAGERMPWLTVHIALPMILTAGWGVGYLIETIHWNEVRQRLGWLVPVLAIVFLVSLARTLDALFGMQALFQGNLIDQIQPTSNFLTAFMGLLLSGYGLAQLLRSWQFADLRRVGVLIGFVIFTVLTLRTAIRAAFINYDTALEFLVYAHSARGPKDALAQIEEISYRTTGAKDIVVAYDSDVNYPFWWYLRDYPKKVFYGENPTRELRNDPIVMVGEAQFNKVDPILGNDYFKTEYMRLWWPMQDYTGLSWERIINALLDPKMRNAIFQIWFNRNYQPYAELEKRNDLTLSNWQPGQSMRLYIRKDTVAQMWNYGGVSSNKPPQVDPYAAGKIVISPDRVIGSSGTAPGQFNAPRQIAFASNGSIYVADSRNHRIQHISADGKTVVAQWGTYADVSKSSAPGGTFYEPWGIAVGPDGSVYVADTWNNRIQKFSADGKFISMWGTFGEGTRPDTFWGPRGLAVDRQGHLFVTDTGNKRIVVFDDNGKFITQFGSAGTGPGQFDEPVGVAIDNSGLVYISDTWNQRVQVMAPDASGKIYTSLLTWNIDGWFGQSLENKPFIAVNRLGQVFVTDPEGYRVLEFKTNGEFLHTWGNESADQGSVNGTSGVAVDAQGNLWVSDTKNMKLLRFSITQ